MDVSARKGFGKEKNTALSKNPYLQYSNQT